jgi:isochorismate hydrolase
VFDGLKGWLGNLENGITDIYAKVFHADRVETKELCVGQTCLNEQQIQQIIQSVGMTSTSTPVVQNTINPDTTNSDNSINDDITAPGTDETPSDQTVTNDVIPNPDPVVTSDTSSPTE